jgi:hypothetical protein
LSRYGVDNTSELRDSLINLCESNPDEVDFNITNCSWEDVLVEVERANRVAGEFESVDSIRGRIRRSRNWIWGATEAIVPTIPTDLCILNAGLAAVFSVGAGDLRLVCLEALS